jgi:DNA-binding NarL/FixJ family response regulator
MSKHVLIVDDHAYIRKMLRDFFANESAFTLCGEAADGMDAMAYGPTATACIPHFA